MKNRNKKNKLHLRTKMHKRIVAGITAVAVIMTNLSIGPFYEIGEKLFGTVMSVEAADTYEEWVVEGDEYTISSSDDLAKYSSAYRYDEVNDPTGVGHSKDTLVINLTTGTDITDNADIVSPFYSIGQVKPFRGTIVLNGISNNYINIDKALFDQIGEETVIKIEGSEAARELVINRSADSADPIFAKKVVAKESGATTSGSTLGWVIRSKTLVDTGNPINSKTAGLIGEIEDGCNVKVSFTDERCMEVSSSTGDVGYICGTLGQNANLEISSLSASNNVTVTASGTDHDAGAIVGSMGDGSTLTLPATMESFPVASVTASGDNSYAGGLVGNNYGGSVVFSSARAADSKFTVDQIISGKVGSGGLFGYYSPKLTDGSASLSYDDYHVNCSLNGEGSSGGLFGVLYNSGNVTISDGTSNADHIQVINSNTTNDYGGLIGKYSANELANTLTLTNCSSKLNQSGSATGYGGAIGTVNSKSYVRINNCTTNNIATKEKSANFGGIVGIADGAFVDVNGLTVTAAADFNGGGVVNALGNGVLRMQGTIDLSGAKSSGGQIIKSRNSGFAFFDGAGWTLKRSTSAAAVDDVASWGEVIRFGSTLTQSDVLNNFTDGDHTVALKSAVATMGSTADFAKTALNIQHNTGEITSGVMTFSGDGSNTLLGTNLSLSTSLIEPLSLVGTGIQGLTRDDGSQAYTATFNGNGKTLNLAIGEQYGERSGSAVAADATGCGKIYKHANVGLFGKTTGATIQNVSLAGNIYVSSAATQSVGAAAAENAGGFTAYGVTVNTAMHNSGSSQLLMGGLLGKSTSGDITIGGTGNISNDIAVAKACTINANITGSNSYNSSCIGGAIGFIEKNEFTASINNVTVSGTIRNSSQKQRQEIGGLIAYIEAGSGSRTLSLDSITINGLTVEGAIVQTQDDNKAYIKDALSIGGLLGYAWYDTAVSMNSVTVSGSPVIRADIGELNGIDVDMSGLVYAGSGSWSVGSVSIPSISVVTYTDAKTPAATTNIRSFGMIVNRSFKVYKDKDGNVIYGNSLYLVLPNMSSYKLGTYSESALTSALSKTSNFGGFNDTTVFDELVAYSAFYEDDSYGVRTSKVLENGQGIVSIRTRGNTSTVNNVMKTNTCNTYQNQVTGVNMGNPNTRYYYDIDLLLAKKDNATKETPTATLTSSDKLMLWSLNQYAHSSLTGTGKPFNYNPFSNNVIAPTGSETFDMDGYSYYPVDVSGATIKGTFKLYNQEIEYGESGKNSSGVATAFTPTDSYVRTTLVDSVSAFSTNPYTQHHLMQNGIFLNAKNDIIINGELKLQGTIGADTYNSTGSGSLICGTLQGYLDANNEAVNASLTTKADGQTAGNIKLDGVKVHNIGTRDSSLAYAPLLVNRIDSYTNVVLENVSNTSAYGTTGVVAATSLIGDAGTSKDTSRNINLTFNKIKLDGRSEAISIGNSDLTDTYDTSLSLFTKATLLNKYQYFTGSTGIYNYMQSEDWGTDGSGSRYVTYGKEVGYADGTGEWGSKEQHYMKETTEGAGAPNYTRPDGWPLTNSLYGEFGKFLKYVATDYSDANKTHELKVNHGKATITGCGTYNHPYLITEGDQLKTIADIISGINGGSVEMPKNAADIGNKWHGTNGCESLTYSDSTGKYGSRSTDEVRQHLAGAYYKISGNIDLPSDYVGLGSSTDSRFGFCGVIVSDNNAVITNYSDVPLILNSNGCVVKGITVEVKKAGITTVDVTASNVQFSMNTSVEAYGAIIGKVHGGDNIFDGVGVTFNSVTTISPVSKRTPVGGYVGVVIAGDVIFKNMGSVSNKTGLISARCSMVSDSEYLYVNPIIGRVINGYAVTESNAYRPIEDPTRTGFSSANNVTMKNGIKNYSITDISPSEGKLALGAYSAVSDASTATTQKTTVTFPSAQSIFVLSCLIQSGVTTATYNTTNASNNFKYANGNTNVKSYASSSNNNVTYKANSYQNNVTLKPSRLAGYNHIGEEKDSDNTSVYPITNTSKYPGYSDYEIALADLKAVSPYLVANYVNTTNQSSIYHLTYSGVVCDIGFDQNASASSAWVLPDGFRGLGSVAFGTTNDNQLKAMTLSVNKVSGLIGTNVVNLNLNMNLKHYDYTFDNYKPYGKAGFGLFNTIRQNRTDQTPAGNVPLTLEDRTDDDYKIMYLDISGTINYDVVHNTGSMEYSRYNVLGITSGSSVDTNYINVGGFAGYSGFGSNENLNVEHVGIDGLTVNGFKTAGGIFGYLYMANSNSHLVTISNIDTDNLTVTTKLYAGGIVGYANQLGMTIDEVKILEPDIRTYFVGNDYENGTAGVIGCLKSGTNNFPATLSNITIGNLLSQNSSYIGRDSTVELHDDGKNVDKYNRIAVGGIVGECNTSSTSVITTSNPYSLLIDRCKVYNVDMAGNRVAGIIAHYGNGTDSAGGSSLKLSNVEVKSNNNSTITGMTYKTDYSNRGCAGIAGYIRLASNRIAHFDHCTVEGYHFVSYNDTAGLCANIQNNGTMKVENVQLKNLKFESCYAGGMCAYTNLLVNGFNIRVENLQFKKYNNGDYLRKGFASLIVKTQGCKIHIVGFSRQEPDSLDSEYESSAGMTCVSTKNDTWDRYAYGSGGYVIFADYKGASTTEQKNDWHVETYDEPQFNNENIQTETIQKKKLSEYNTFSPIHDGNNNVAITSQDSYELPKTVTTGGVTKAITDLNGNIVKYNEYYHIDQNFPFVTSSSSVDIGINSVGTDENGVSRNHMQFLTSDGLSGKGATGFSYVNTAAHAVLTDLGAETKPKNYYNQLSNVLNTSSAITTFDELIASKYSTFKDVSGTDYPTFMRQNNLDFPVLLIDNNEPVALTDMLNKYLQTLTNTNYNFAAGKVSMADNAANADSIFKLKLAKCEFDTNKFTVTYNSSTEQTDNSSLYTRNGNFTFNIGNVDSGKAQFTLIDVEFYDPSTSGNSKKVAYHLYVPVYVSQMLVYDLQISSKSGSTYKLDQYTAERGNYTLENLGTPITIEARYIYQRGLADWLQAANNGEKIYRSAPKIWDIDDQTDKGFPADTKMVLVDPNQGNKAYYSTITGQQVYGTVEEGQTNPYVTDQTAVNTEVSKLYLNKFVDSDRNAFTARKYNDYLDFTATVSNSTAGTFVPASESDATVVAKVNGVATLMKPKTDETTGTFYVLNSVVYSSAAQTYTSGTKTYLMEDYYVTLFTESSNTANMYHLGFRAPTSLGDTYPSRYTRLANGSTVRQITYVLVGNLFSFEDASLTTTIREGVDGSEKGTREVDIASAIEVEVTNKICLTEGMFANKSFLSRQSVHIYQSFLLSLNKQTSETQTHRGIDAEPAVKMQEYTVGTYNVLADSTNAYYTLYQGTNPNYDSNYIYLYNGRDLRTSLASLANVASYSDVQGLEIKAKLSLTYASTDEISNQYPKREDAELEEEIKGTWIGCNSSIASTVAATVGSPMTIYITEKTGETVGNPKSHKLYYTRSSASAHLLYKSDDDDGKYSGYYYDQLGINASDLPEGVTDNQSPMNTLAVYDVSELLGVADTADYVELTISLYRKDAEGKYTVALNPADYITAPTFGNTATGTITAASSDTPSAGRIYTYTFNRAALQSNASVYSGGVYTIPINYSVKTAFSGSDQATHFYSNYKVVVSASMYKNEVENENTVSKMLNGTDDDDHLIYTNAKINSNAFD